MLMSMRYPNSQISNCIVSRVCTGETESSPLPTPSSILPPWLKSTGFCILDQRGPTASNNSLLRIHPLFSSQWTPRPACHIILTFFTKTTLWDWLGWRTVTGARSLGKFPWQIKYLDLVVPDPLLIISSSSVKAYFVVGDWNGMLP